MSLPDTPVPLVPPPQPTHTNMQPSWRLLGFIIGSAMLLTVVSIASISLLGNNHFSLPGISLTHSTPTPTPTPNTEQQAFFASLPNSMIYYSFAQTSSSRNVFQSDPTDATKRTINIGFPGNYQFIISPNGQWILRYDIHSMQKAASTNPDQFSNLATFTNQPNIDSVTISADSSQVAIASSQKKLKDGHIQYNNEIQIISIDQSHRPTSIYKQTNPFQVKLFGLVNNQLWYAENRNGQLSNLTSYDISTSQVNQSYVAFNQAQLLSTIQFSADMAFAYIYTTTSVTEYLMTDNQSRVIYQLDTSCPSVKQTNPSTISGFSVSPFQPLLLIDISVKDCTTTTKVTPVLDQQLLLVDAKTGQIIKQQSHTAVSNFSQASWSTDSQYVWTTIDASTHYLITVSTLQSQLLPSADQQTISKEKLYLLGWLAAAK